MVNCVCVKSVKCNYFTEGSETPWKRVLIKRTIMPDVASCFKTIIALSNGFIVL